MKTVCLDFDGVIHLNINFVSSTIISGELVVGAAQAIATLREKYRVVVHSCRCTSAGGVQAIKDWLKQHEIEVDDVIDFKPQAEVYIDDRAVAFNGDWNETLGVVYEFKPWTRRKKERYVAHQRRYKTAHRSRY